MVDTSRSSPESSWQRSGPTTIIGSFNQNLPNLAPSSTGKYVRVSPSRPTTANAKPPLVLLCGSSDSLALKTDTALDVPIVKNSLRKNNVMHTDLGSSFPLENEASVKDASVQYILSDIYEILNILYPGKWRVRPECNNVSLHKTVPKKVEDTDLDDEQPKTKKRKTKDGGAEGNEDGEPENVRYDLIFEEIPEDGEMAKTVAVLEYKKTWMIRYADFKDGLVPDNAPENTQDLLKMALLKPLIRDNGATYLKQVSTYSSTRKCPHVALFNWDHLLLFEFTGLGYGILAAGDRAHLIWVSEQKRSDDLHVNEGPIRKALLGWLLGIFDRHFAENREDLGS
jgi:hypothetical protein